MELVIRNTTNQPIYDQIYSQIKAQIIAGKLSPGEALPSIRALAKDLRISVITTKRAYDELEADGFLFTVAGKGCFVAEKNLDLIREQKLKELEDHLDAAVELAAQCGISSAQLQEMLRILLREEGTHERD
ncbi:GntR family transcriptional regulator [Pusillibacter faecalis]|uniref:GntR family transcriptional regulator n=1 Tax=Pusillibacter faecalis TaxID=2714358 RepID=A0A810Q8Z8_9FIRM|nr:GntR family transcriptional regulator [Pusillibacter faecalis]BCK84444.1 GntR family transcriptional regulator [Pusillibacter faecalis]